MNKLRIARRIQSLALGAAVAVPAVIGATLLPSEAAAWSETVCEGQRLSFGIKRPRADIYRGTLTYRYRTANGTAVAGKDYLAAQGTVTFRASVDGARVYVKTLKDGVSEGTESVFLVLHEPEAPQYGGWIEVNGKHVRVETELPATRSYTGYIRDRQSVHPKLDAIGGGC
ncbi:MAG: hypothetical protein F4Z52_09315 [Gammaproteobacteria bacterium]|nr:hypothetical protein [Gammaproteobacteria bacterium]MXX17378.1 hypothetical protein [Gammaproteobacteria bacterium]MXY65072.1 hypothetical protein [Gammaproteobacteria bacterium]MYG65216.1 hypothetical protein [Gammaproteobacteria bacterium]